jgi:hypothetical protein
MEERKGRREGQIGKRSRKRRPGPRGVCNLVVLTCQGILSKSFALIL